MNTLGRMDRGWADGWSRGTGNTTRHSVFPVEHSDLLTPCSSPYPQVQLPHPTPTSRQVGSWAQPFLEFEDQSSLGDRKLVTPLPSASISSPVW